MRQFLICFYALTLAACGSGDTPVISAPDTSETAPAIENVTQSAQTVKSTDPNVSDIICPKVELRAGTETLRNFEVGGPGKDDDLTWQATITNTARECFILGEEVGLKVGVSGRVLLGPKGKPGTYSVPVRIAVVRGDSPPLWSRVNNVSATIPAGEAAAIFTSMQEDILFPRDPKDNLANVRVYVGFDPQGARAAEKAKAAEKSKKR